MNKTYFLVSTLALALLAPACGGESLENLEDEEGQSTSDLTRPTAKANSLAVCLPTIIYEYPKVGSVRSAKKPYCARGERAWVKDVIRDTSNNSGPFFAQLPGWGKDGSNGYANIGDLLPVGGNGRVTIRIKTGNVDKAGTDENVYLTLHTDRGDIEIDTKNLDKSGYDDFKTGDLDTYSAPVPDFNKLTGITVSLYGGNLKDPFESPDWYCEYISVDGIQFDVKDWTYSKVVTVTSDGKKSIVNF